MEEELILDLDSIKEPYVTPCYIPPGYYLAKLFYVKGVYAENDEIFSIDWYWEIIRGEKTGVQIVSSTPSNRKYLYKLSEYVTALIYKLYNLPEGTRKFRPDSLVGGEVILQIATEKVGVRKGLFEERARVVKVLHPLTRLSKWGEKLS